MIAAAAIVVLFIGTVAFTYAQARSAAAASRCDDRITRIHRLLDPPDRDPAGPRDPREGRTPP